MGVIIVCEKRSLHNYGEKMQTDMSAKEMCAVIGCTYAEIESALEARDRYSIRRLPKTHGGFRTIVEVPAPLKLVQLRLHRWFEKAYRKLLHERRLVSVVHGCVKGKGPLTNALAHRRDTEFFSCDLADAFGQVNESKLGWVFGAELACDLELQKLLFELTTRNGSVPQGAPTSQDLLNLACLPLDQGLKNWGFCYTRYVDNFYFSGRDPMAMDGAVQQILAQIKTAGFVIAPEKNKRQSVRNGSVHITGISLNDVDHQSTHVLSTVRTTVRLPRKTIKSCRSMLCHALRGEHTKSEVEGKLGWVRMVCQGQLPNALIQPYERYQAAVVAGLIPKNRQEVR